MSVVSKAYKKIIALRKDGIDHNAAFYAVAKELGYNPSFLSNLIHYNKNKKDGLKNINYKEWDKPKKEEDKQLKLFD